MCPAPVRVERSGGFAAKSKHCIPFDSGSMAAYVQGERLLGVGGMSNWGCPHLVDDKCERVNHLPCELGMKGCVLFGRFRFFDESKNRPKPLASTPATKPAAEDKAE